MWGKQKLWNLLSEHSGYLVTWLPSYLVTEKCVEMWGKQKLWNLLSEHIKLKTLRQNWYCLKRIRSFKVKIFGICCVFLLPSRQTKRGTNAVECSGVKVSRCQGGKWCLTECYCTSVIRYTIVICIPKLTNLIIIETFFTHADHWWYSNYNYKLNDPNTP